MIDSTSPPIVNCGDGICVTGESPWSCREDCYNGEYCTNGICEIGETASTCPFDCSVTPLLLGRIARYCGKVNITMPTGTGQWTPDPDCTSGCNVGGGLAYCRRFWPNTTSVVQVPVSAKPNNVWRNAGCIPVVDDWDGTDEFECYGQWEP